MALAGTDPVEVLPLMAGFKAKAPRTGFSRPRSLGGQKVDREWREVYAKDLEVDDIVAGLGVVTQVDRKIRPFVSVVAGVPEPRTHNLYGLDTVKAFIKKEN